MDTFSIDGAKTTLKREIPIYPFALYDGYVLFDAFFWNGNYRPEGFQPERIVRDIVEDELGRPKIKEDRVEHGYPHVQITLAFSYRYNEDRDIDTRPFVVIRGREWEIWDRSVLVNEENGKPYPDSFLPSWGDPGSDGQTGSGCFASSN